MIITRSKELKENNTTTTCFYAKDEVEIFIKEIKEDLDILKEESFQRHEPEYFDEVEYYNNFHKMIPKSLLLSNCYKTFIRLYRQEGKNLFESISAFIDEYEKEKPDWYILKHIASEQKEGR